jgi:uncharacterized membrane protein YcaP (DUF421 family)
MRGGWFPRVLVRNGPSSKKRWQKSSDAFELIEALRREGCTSLKKIRFAVLENDGTITVGMRLSRASKAVKSIEPHALAGQPS